MTFRHRHFEHNVCLKISPSISSRLFVNYHYDEEWKEACTVPHFDTWHNWFIFHGIFYVFNKKKRSKRSRYHIISEHLEAENMETITAFLLKFNHDENKS